MSCNLLRNADHSRIHHDNEEDEDEWTFLVYLTPNWTINDYGETVFYERNSDDTEIIAEIRPKYGRAVIFQGLCNTYYAIIRKLFNTFNVDLNKFTVKRINI